MSSLKAMVSGFAVLFFESVQAANAQVEAQTYSLENALQICARVPDTPDRLACFEELARKVAPDAGEKTAAVAPETAVSLPVIAPASQIAADESKSRYVVMRAEDYEKEKSKAVEPAAPERAVYEAVVLRAWRYSNGEYNIALTNGEIWKSQATDNPRPIKDGEKVEVHPGAVGGWFMQFKTIKRPTIRVTLVK